MKIDEDVDNEIVLKVQPMVNNTDEADSADTEEEDECSEEEDECSDEEEEQLDEDEA